MLRINDSSFIANRRCQRVHHGVFGQKARGIPSAGATAMTHQIVALLGRRDEPTDAVEEYCRYLGTALLAHGLNFSYVRIPWAERGWSAALHEVTQKAAEWRGQWVCVQYTALA